MGRPTLQLLCTKTGAVRKGGPGGSLRHTDKIECSRSPPRTPSLPPPNRHRLPANRRRLAPEPPLVTVGYPHTAVADHSSAAGYPRRAAVHNPRR